MMESPEQHPDGEQEASSEVRDGAQGWIDDAEGFSGNPQTKLDERGRLKMPAEFRAVIEKKYGAGFNAFHLTTVKMDMALIYPMPEWKKRKAIIQSMPATSNARIVLEKRDAVLGGDVVMDPQGRLLIPERLRKQVELSGEVLVYGSGDHLQVSSLSKLMDEIMTMQFNDADMDQLQKLGL